MKQITEEQKDKIVAEIIESVDKDFRTYMMLVQFMSIKMGQKAIDMNARELSVNHEVEYNGKRYFIRTATQFTEHGEATLEDRAEEIVERMMEQPNKSSERQEEYDLRTLLKDAVMAGYNLHRQDFDDDEEDDDK